MPRHVLWFRSTLVTLSTFKYHRVAFSKRDKAFPKGGFRSFSRPVGDDFKEFNQSMKIIGGDKFSAQRSGTFSGLDFVDPIHIVIIAQRDT